MTVRLGVTSLLARLTRDQRGGHTVQMAIAIVLFALVAAFGFYSMGDAIADFFDALSGPFDQAFR
jgi:Flp pilus assembly protein TadG